jgi:hypothetical protein
MALSLIGVGTTANDGTGDPLRTAFQTVNTALTAVNNAVVVGTGVTTFKDDSGSAGVSVLSSGFVGVGTTAPPVNLVVNVATAATEALRLTNSADSARLHMFCGEIQAQNGSLVLNVVDGFGLTIKTVNTARAAINSGGDFTWQNDGASVGMTWDASANTNAGGLGIGTATPTEQLDLSGDAIRIRTSQTPASAAATGDAGMICWDASYIYVCTATNTWKRTAITTW